MKIYLPFKKAHHISKFIMWVYKKYGWHTCLGKPNSFLFLTNEEKYITK